MIRRGAISYDGLKSVTVTETIALYLPPKGIRPAPQTTLTSPHVQRFNIAPAKADKLATLRGRVANDTSVPVDRRSINQSCEPSIAIRGAD